MKNKIEILSREAAKKQIAKGLLLNAAVISFYDPKSEPNAYEPICYTKACSRFFQVPVNDVDIEELSELGLTFDTYFPEAPALAIFIKEAISAGCNIVCQCEYGQSRSPACAAAIMEYYDKSGIQIFADYRYCPSQLIYNKLIAALQEHDSLLIP